MSGYVNCSACGYRFEGKSEPSITMAMDGSMVTVGCPGCRRKFSVSPLRLFRDDDGKANSTMDVWNLLNGSKYGTM